MTMFKVLLFVTVLGVCLAQIDLGLRKRKVSTEFNGFDEEDALDEGQGGGEVSAQGCGSEKVGQGNKKHSVLWKKGEHWDQSKIEIVLEQIKTEYSERITLIETHLEAKGKQLDQLIKNPVPIGFIYVQLSGQAEPHTLWAQTEWDNISSKYAGLFFRAEGGGSSAFGQIQSEQQRSLQIYNGVCGCNDPKGCTWADYTLKQSYKVCDTFSSKSFYTGESDGGGVINWYGINFKYTTDEIRPRNQAIRIWIRIN